MANLGSKERPLRVVVVGSGPSGFYAAEALLKSKEITAEVDIIDRLPFPYGLVRGGVAPDHQKIKGVTKVYERTAALPGFRFFGNVKLGADIQVADLKKHYDAIIYAVGNESDRALGIPGDDLKGSVAATEFVGWYNGHPDYRELKFDLSCERVAVIGIGNVAMDVTRALANDPDELAVTDMADYAVEALRKSKVKEILVLGRRGAAQAAFSPTEIKEIAELPNADLVVRSEDAELDPISKAEYDKNATINQKKTVEFLQAQAKKGEGTLPKKVRLILCASPVEITGENGAVKAVKIEKNELYKDEKRGSIRPRGTGKTTTEEIGLILRSVGYFGVEIPGVSFDKKKGRIPNKNGRVLNTPGGEPLAGEYVVGWAKRGPSGLVGTNRACSYETVRELVADLKDKPAQGGEDRTAAAADKLIKAKQPKHIRFEDWKVLDKLELENGAKKGKVREKFTNISEALAALADARQATA